jgi:TPR repeat protein
LEDLTKKATAGLATAQYELAMVYLHGNAGTQPQDVQQWLHWQTLAATNGLAEAQRGLIIYHAYGEQPNPVQAMKWAIVYRRTNPQEADALMRPIDAQLTSEQRKQAQALAAGVR